MINVNCPNPECRLPKQVLSPGPYQCERCLTAFGVDVTGGTQTLSNTLVAVDAWWWNVLLSAILVLGIDLAVALVLVFATPTFNFRQQLKLSEMVGFAALVAVALGSIYCLLFSRPRID